MYNKELCSYCQREYGTLSINNKPIFKTFDHLKPRLLSSKDRQGNGRRGIMSRGVSNYEELDNLITCCNECNELKGKLTLDYFARKLSYFLKNKYRDNKCSYLNKDLILKIRYSILILQKNETNPIELQIYTTDLLL